MPSDPTTLEVAAPAEITANVKAYEAPAASNMTAAGLRDSRAMGLLGILKILGPYIGQLTALLRGVDLTKLPALLSAVQAYRAITLPITTPAGIQERVRAGLSILLAWADITPGDRDEELITRVRDWLENRPQVVELLAQTVAALLARFQASDAVPPELDQTVAVANAVNESGDGKAFAAANLDLGQWAQIVQIVWQLIQLLR